MEHLFVNVCIPMFCSKLHNHAEKWCRSPHSQLLLLGHQYWWWEGISYTIYSVYFHKVSPFWHQKCFICLLHFCKLSTQQFKRCYSPSISFSILTLLHLFTALTFSVKCFFLLSLLVYLMCEIILFQEAAQSGGRIAPCTVLSVCLLLPWQYDDWWCAALTPSHMMHPWSSSIS